MKKTRAKTIKDIMIIDKYDLDNILCNYPHEYYEDTKNLPKLQEKVAMAKLTSDTIKSALYIQMKQEMAEAGERVTEKAIETRVATHPEYVKAQKDYLAYRLEFAEADRVNEVYMRKDAALKGLIALYGSQYWVTYGKQGTKSKSDIDLEELSNRKL